MHHSTDHRPQHRPQVLSMTKTQFSSSSNSNSFQSCQCARHHRIDKDTINSIGNSILPVMSMRKASQNRPRHNQQHQQQHTFCHVSAQGVTEQTKTQSAASATAYFLSCQCARRHRRTNTQSATAYFLSCQCARHHRTDQDTISNSISGSLLSVMSAHKASQNRPRHNQQQFTSCHVGAQGCQNDYTQGVTEQTKHNQLQQQQQQLTSSHVSAQGCQVDKTAH